MDFQLHVHFLRYLGYILRPRPIAFCKNIRKVVNARANCNIEAVIHQVNYFNLFLTTAVLASMHITKRRFSSESASSTRVILTLRLRTTALIEK